MHSTVLMLTCDPPSRIEDLFLRLRYCAYTSTRSFSRMIFTRPTGGGVRSLTATKHANSHCGVMEAHTKQITADAIYSPVLVGSNVMRLLQYFIRWRSGFDSRRCAVRNVTQNYRAHSSKEEHRARTTEMGVRFSLRPTIPRLVAARRLISADGRFDSAWDYCKSMSSNDSGCVTLIHEIGVRLPAWMPHTASLVQRQNAALPTRRLGFDSRAMHQPP